MCLRYNRVLRRIFGLVSEEVARGWRTLHNEELPNLYNSPNFIWVIKSKRMRLVVHLARTGRLRHTKFGCRI